MMVCQRGRMEWIANPLNRKITPVVQIHSPSQVKYYYEYKRNKEGIVQVEGYGQV